MIPNKKTYQPADWITQDEWTVNRTFEPINSDKVAAGYPYALKFSEKGVATLLIVQSYEKLFYDGTIMLKVPI